VQPPQQEIGIELLEFRLALDFNGRPKSAVAGSCVVSELTDYCRQQVKC